MDTIDELKQIRGEVEKIKGGGKVTSGSPGPMFDWGCDSGFDIALGLVLSILDSYIERREE